jgi:hypothetical protein
LFSKGFKWIFLMYLIIMTLVNTIVVFLNIYIGEYPMAMLGVAVSFVGIAGSSAIYKSLKQ